MAVVIGETPPTEFRLFEAGWNETERGAFLFDEAAASSVMGARETHGVDVMLDLEHLSLDEESRNFDPDARAWFRLELRNGELWAVDVKWTPDGERRLRERTQRYISPTFDFDPESRRVLRLFNVALTALPATHGTPHLVAARTSNHAALEVAQLTGTTMTPEMVKKALEALKNGDSEAALGILEGLLAEAAGGEAEPEPEPEPAPEAMAMDDEEEMMSEVAAATSRLFRLSGKSSIGEAVREVEAWRASHLELEEGRAKLAKEREALELSERRDLTAELVKLGSEVPATAWEDSTKKGGLRPCKRLMDEPIESLRARVATLGEAKGKKRDTPPRPPASDDGASEGAKVFTIHDGARVELSARELRICEEKGADPKVYAANKALRAANKAG